MARFKRSRSRSSKLSKKWYLVTTLAVAVILFLVLELTNTIDVIHKKPTDQVVVTVGNPVPSPKANSSSSQTVEKKPSSNTGSRNSGGAVDTNGSSATNTSQGQWTVSKSGLITVKQPVANARLKSGDIIAGSAKLSTVNYRLIDNVVGVIAQGQLKVVNGNFSGVLNFQTSGTGGRLDVFSLDDQLVERNEVQINVRF